LKSLVLEVSGELGIPSDGVQVEPAMGAPNSDSIQVRIPDGRGDARAVVVDLRDKDGNGLDENGVRERLREKLSAFKTIDEI
jgi:hypothetical protein